MNARLAVVTAASLAALLLAGCGGGPAATVAAGLTDEDRAFAETEDEVWGFLPKPEPEPEPEPVPVVKEPEIVVSRPEPRPRPRPVPRPPRPRPPKRRRFEIERLSSGLLVRGGMLMTVAAEEGDWPMAMNYGVGYRMASGTTSATIIDLSLDMATVESTDGAVKSDLLSVRGEVLLGSWNAYSRKPILYFVGGGYAIMANSSWSTGAVDGTSSSATGLEAGVGFGSASGKWDLRAVYSFLAGSQNVTGNVLVSFGFSM
jgi:hypothetical protein